MESLISSAKSAVLDPNLAPIWFRQLHHNNIFSDQRFHVTQYVIRRENGIDQVATTDVFDLGAVQASAGTGGVSQSQPIATFKLLQIHSITPVDFLALIQAYGIDDAALLVLNSGAFHFQHFEHLTNSSTAPTSMTFGLAYNVATLLWTFDSITQTVNAIAFGERDRPFNTAQIQRFKADLAQPLGIGLLALQSQLETLHVNVRELLQRLRGVETDTGYRAKTQASGKIDFARIANLDLASVAQKVSNIQYEAISLARSFNATAEILRDMFVLADYALLGAGVGASADARGRKLFKSGIAWRLKSTESLQEQTQYLLSRVQVQNTVVINLRAQRDAELSLDVARQSENLALAAKKDSSSMQTVAVMTMGFLPATFYAALFAMPLLRWDESPVIQDEFWVYLVFTFPSTLAVFLVWIVLTKQDFLRRSIDFVLKPSKSGSATVI